MSNTRDNQIYYCQISMFLIQVNKLIPVSTTSGRVRHKAYFANSYILV